MTSSFVYPGGGRNYRSVRVRARLASAARVCGHIETPQKAEWELVYDNVAPGYTDPGPPRSLPEYVGQIVAVPAVPATTAALPT